MNILEGINKIITKLGSDKKVDNITDGLNQISENISGGSENDNSGGHNSKIISVDLLANSSEFLPNSDFLTMNDLTKFFADLSANKDIYDICLCQKREFTSQDQLITEYTYYYPVLFSFSPTATIVNFKPIDNNNLLYQINYTLESNEINIIRIAD